VQEADIQAYNPDLAAVQPSDEVVQQLQHELIHAHHLGAAEVSEWLGAMKLLTDQQLSGGQNLVTLPAKLAAKAYTSDYIYRQLNEALRLVGGGPAVISAIHRATLLSFKHTRCHLDSAVQSMTGVQPGITMYRGVNFPGCVAFFAEHYQVGGLVEWPEYTSTSTARDVAKGFASDQGVVFEMTDFPGNFGGNVKRVSVFEGEDEILLPAGTCFKVIQVQLVEPRVIRLRYLGVHVRMDEGAAVEAVRVQARLSEMTARLQAADERLRQSEELAREAAQELALEQARRRKEADEQLRLSEGLEREAAKELALEQARRRKFVCCSRPS
jgi:hypothetical protein